MWTKISTKNILHYHLQKEMSYLASNNKHDKEIKNLNVCLNSHSDTVYYFIESACHVD